MNKSLAEYAAQHPQPEPERQAAGARSYWDQQQERAEVDRLKGSITQQLEQGAAPQYILYTALQAIGILTHDTEWTEAGTQALDKVYSDLAQQSFLTDDAIEAARRLEAQRSDYTEKLRKQLTKQIRDNRKIERALQEALQTLDSE